MDFFLGERGHWLELLVVFWILLLWLLVSLVIAWGVAERLALWLNLVGWLVLLRWKLLVLRIRLLWVLTKIRWRLVVSLRNRLSLLPVLRFYRILLVLVRRDGLVLLGWDLLWWILFL